MQLRAVDHLTEDMDVVASAERFAIAARRALLDGDAAVVLDFAGLPATSSSYFNLIVHVLDEVPGGLSLLDDELRLRFGSPRQRAMFERSREAVRAQRRSGTVP
jgi:hypothetical protein